MKEDNYESYVIGPDTFSSIPSIDTKKNESYFNAACNIQEVIKEIGVEPKVFHSDDFKRDEYSQFIYLNDSYYNLSNIYEDIDDDKFYNNIEDDIFDFPLQSGLENLDMIIVLDDVGNKSLAINTDSNIFYDIFEKLESENNVANEIIKNEVKKDMIINSYYKNNGKENILNFINKDEKFTEGNIKNIYIKTVTEAFDEIDKEGENLLVNFSNSKVINLVNSNIEKEIKNINKKQNKTFSI